MPLTDTQWARLPLELCGLLRLLWVDAGLLVERCIHWLALFEEKYRNAALDKHDFLKACYKACGQSLIIRPFFAKAMSAHWYKISIRSLLFEKIQ